MEEDLTVLSVTWNQMAIGYLPRFVECVLNQTRLDRTKCIILHDGPSEDGSKQYMDEIVFKHPKVFTYIESESRKNIWGHDLRAMGLPLVDTEWINFNNCDNIIESNMVEEVIKNSYDSEILTWKIRHSYFNFQPFYVGFALNGCDMMQAAIRTKIAQEVGFNHRDSAADGRFFNDIRKKYKDLKTRHIPLILGTHN